MKYIWEAIDIKVGIRYTRPGIGEVHMIGYMADRGDRRYVSVSLEDGMVQPPKTDTEWADDLTQGGYEPCPR